MREKRLFENKFHFSLGLGFGWGLGGEADCVALRSLSLGGSGGLGCVFSRSVILLGVFLLLGAAELLVSRFAPVFDE
jgi:hypothetical protein